MGGSSCRCVALGLAAGATRRATADVVITFEAPGVDLLALNTTVENFDSFSTGVHNSGLVTSIGTFDTAIIHPPDIYGGAGGTGKYITPDGMSTLTLNTSQSYFGFWWSAADGSNRIEFYSSGTLVASFNPNTALAALGSAYYGNPSGTYQGGDSGEKFAFMNVYGTNGTTFDKIEIYGTGFESDNYTISANPGSVHGTSITPEPSSFFTCAVGGLLWLGYSRTRRAAKARG